jgi:hypothetical protein
VSALSNTHVVVEVTPDGESAALARVGEDKRIAFTAWWEHFRWANVFRFFAPGRFPGGVSVSVHPSLVHTAHVPFRFTRKKGEHLLGREQFEQFLMQKVHATQSRCRKEAAKRLSADALDVVIVAARVRELFEGGRSVPLSKIGDTSELEGTLEVVFTPRRLSREWGGFFNAGGGFSFHDSLEAQFEAIRKVAPAAQQVAEVGWGETLLMAKKARGTDGRVAKGRTPWSYWEFSHHMGEQLGVSADAMRRIFLYGGRGGLSGTSARAFFRASRPFAVRLAKEIEKAGFSGIVYVNSPFPLFQSERFRGGSVSLVPAPTDLIEAQLGFSVTEAGAVPLQKLFPYLASFMKFYYDTSNVGVNRFLKKRLHWLA